MKRRGAARSESFHVRTPPQRPSGEARLVTRAQFMAPRVGIRSPLTVHPPLAHPRLMNTSSTLWSALSSLCETTCTAGFGRLHNADHEEQASPPGPTIEEHGAQQQRRARCLLLETP